MMMSVTEERSKSVADFEEILTGLIDGVYVTSKKVTSVCVDGWLLDMRITTLPPKGMPLSYRDKLFYCPFLPNPSTKETKEHGRRKKDGANVGDEGGEEEMEEEEKEEDVACFASSLSFLPIKEHPGYTHVQMQRKKGNGTLIWKLVNKQPRTTVREGLRVRNPPAKAPSFFSSSSSSCLPASSSSSSSLSFAPDLVSAASSASFAKRKRSHASSTIDSSLVLPLGSDSTSLVLSCMGDMSDLLPSVTRGGGCVLQL